MAQRENKPIVIEPGAIVSIQEDTVSVSGPAGQVTVVVPGVLATEIKDQLLSVSSRAPGENRPIVGLFRGLLSNALIGVVKGWSKQLELVGVGYRAETSGKSLTLHVGFSHPVVVDAPEGVTFQVQENKITVISANKYLAGEIAATIRRVKPPEPYKGKGIRYVNEHIRRKVGKAAKAVGGTGAK